uniref:Uncharacterized protein n=1 Tax=Oryza rufipogon TaxID=4529 RepID=A0A0E0PIQ4_ORYRU
MTPPPARDSPRSSLLSPCAFSLLLASPESRLPLHYSATIPTGDTPPRSSCCRRRLRPLPWPVPSSQAAAGAEVFPFRRCFPPLPLSEPTSSPPPSAAARADVFPTPIRAAGADVFPTPIRRGRSRPQSPPEPRSSPSGADAPITFNIPFPIAIRSGQSRRHPHPASSSLPKFTAAASRPAEGHQLQVIELIYCILRFCGLKIGRSQD